MDPESKKLLEQTLDLAKENNEMLRKVRRVQKMTIFFNFLYWFLIIAIAIGALYFIQPFIDQTQDFFKSAGITLDLFKGIP